MDTNLIPEAIEPVQHSDLHTDIPPLLFGLDPLVLLDHVEKVVGFDSAGIGLRFSRFALFEFGFLESHSHHWFICKGRWKGSFG